MALSVLSLAGQAEKSESSTWHSHKHSHRHTSSQEAGSERKHSSASEEAPRASHESRAGKDSSSDSDWRKEWRRKWLRRWKAGQAGLSSEKRTETAKAATTGGASLAGAQSAAPAPLSPPAITASARPVGKPFGGVTKPDPFGATEAASHNRTQDSPLTAVGDAWKMLAYLFPMLLLTLGGLHLLRRFYERTGRLPGAARLAASATGGVGASWPRRPGGGLMNALVGGFHLNTIRQHGGCNIRLVESVPIGGANIHLIEVRGKLLLIGATSAGVSLLTEFSAPEVFEPGDFRALLQSAAADMDSLDLAEPELPEVAMVGTLEEAMRETSDAVARRARRLRTVQEEEDASA